MDRDTKIGLVLALAFVGLVGAVLYHKMENPGTLHAVTPPVAVAQGTPPEDQPLVGDTPAKSTSEEPPPPAPPANPTPPTENKESQGRIVINTGTPPRQANSWWPWKKSETVAIAKNDMQVSPPGSPPGPPSAPSSQETLMHFPPAQSNPPVAKKEGGWFHFLHREKKKEQARPAGLTFDQPASSSLPPTKPPEQPTVKNVVLTTPSSQGNGFQPPSGPQEPTPPVAILPEKKSDTPLPPMVSDKKTEGPLFPPQPPSEPTITTLPVVKNDPPSPPMKNESPVLRNDPPPPAPVNMDQSKPPTNTQVTQQKEIKTDNTKPSPSVTLGRPQDDNTQPVNPPRENTESKIVGQPVIIRRQEDLPPQREGIPVVTRPGAVITKEYPRPQVQVTATEIRSYTPKQGETYATISRLFYGHEKYETALAQFNKERNPRLASVWPGERIVYPSDKEYLERKYPALINTSAPRSPLDATGPTSRYVQPNDIQAVEARVSQPQKKPIISPSNTAPNPVKSVGSGLRYRVREKDSLYSIAQKTLGKGERWNEIYALNKEVVRDPNQPEVGLLLKLPADAKVDTAATPE